MGLKYVALVAVLYFCAHVTMAAPVDSSSTEAPKPWNWNSILYAKEIFRENLNAIKTTDRKNSDAVVEELKALLSNQENFNVIYGNYKKLFQKDLDSSRDDKVHGEIFKTKLYEIAAHNVKADAGEHSWWKGVNQFTDMSEKELSQSTGGLIAPGK